MRIDANEYEKLLDGASVVIIDFKVLDVEEGTITDKSSARVMEADIAKVITEEKWASEDVANALVRNINEALPESKFLLIKPTIRVFNFNAADIFRESIAIAKSLKREAIPSYFGKVSGEELEQSSLIEHLDSLASSSPENIIASEIIEKRDVSLFERVKSSLPVNLVKYIVDKLKLG